MSTINLTPLTLYYSNLQKYGPSMAPFTNLLIYGQKEKIASGKFEFL